MDIKRKLLEIEWLWIEVEYRPERHDVDGYYSERWTYKHILFPKIRMFQKYRTSLRKKTSKSESIKIAIDRYYEREKIHY